MISIKGGEGTYKPLTGIDYGEVTLADNPTSIEVTHNLGVVPSYAAIIPKDLSQQNTTSKTLVNINGKLIERTNGAITTGNGAITVTTNSIEFISASSYPFHSISYYWIAIV